MLASTPACGVRRPTLRHDTSHEGFPAVASYPPHCPTWQCRLVALVGLVLNCMGYLGVWAGATGRLAVMHWHVAVLIGLANCGGTFVDVACLATNIRNFPNERGTVIGASSCKTSNPKPYTTKLNPNLNQIPKV